jgi:hypothetical protein
MNQEVDLEIIIRYPESQHLRLLFRATFEAERKQFYAASRFLQNRMTGHL